MRSLNVSKNEGSFLPPSQSRDERNIEGLQGFMVNSKVYLFLIASEASKRNINVGEDAQKPLYFSAEKSEKYERRSFPALTHFLSAARARAHQFSSERRSRSRSLFCERRSERRSNERRSLILCL